MTSASRPPRFASYERPSARATSSSADSPNDPLGQPDGAGLPVGRQRAQTLEHDLGLDGDAARQCDRELLAPVARERVAPTEHRAPGCRRALQQPIAALMAVAVVEILEVVEVDDADAQRSPRSPRVADRSANRLVPDSSIRQAGQLVGLGEVAEARDEVGPLDRDRGFDGEQLRRPASSAGRRRCVATSRR